MPARAASLHPHVRSNHLTLRKLTKRWRTAYSISRHFHASSAKRSENGPNNTTKDEYYPFATKPIRQIGSTDTYRIIWSQPSWDKESQEPKIKNPIWKPSEAQGVRDLAALLDAVKAMKAQSKTADAKNEKDAEKVTDEDGLSHEGMPEKDELPLSPLEILNGTHKRNMKRRPTKEELDRLRSNPWAKMLAASLRQCMATRTRFPAPLMIDVGQVVNPNDLEVYLMPDAMADLQEFNKRLQSGKMSKAISLKGGKGEKLKILPYQLIFEKLTDTFMAVDTKSKQTHTRSGAVSKALFPTRWFVNSQKISAYQSASNEYYKVAEKQGLTDEIHQRPQPMPDADKVLWQPAIVERIPNIMRQRILLCLKRLADVDLKYNDGSLKHLYRFEWPADAELDLSIIDQDMSSTTDFWNDMGDIEAKGAVTGDGERQGERVDGRAPITLQAWELDKEATQAQNDLHTWIPGSFLLHLGPATLPKHHSTTTGKTSPDSSPTLPLQHDKFVPPMMTLGTYRLPVFNLYSMFGTQFIEVLLRLLATYSIFRPDSALVTTTTSSPSPYKAEAEANDTQNNPTLNRETNYLILVKSTAPCAHFLAKELWQLWRYLGGTDCLLASGTTPRQTRIDMTHNMSPQAWNQLYQMLEMRRSDPLASGQKTSAGMDVLIKHVPSADSAEKEVEQKENVRR